MITLEGRNVLIAGGSGSVGTALRREMEGHGCRVTILSRTQSGNGYALWNPMAGQIDEKALQESEVLINLTGEPITSGRWTDKKKELIRSSRVMTASFLGKCLYRIPNHVHTVISASAIGYYGNTGNQWVREESPAAEGFLGTTCAMWEAAASAMRTPARRLIILRIGIVLTCTSGYLAETGKAMKTGLIPVFGTGDQYVSWIHHSDLSGMISHIIQNDTIRGTFNATAPSPVTGREMAVLLKQVTGSAALVVRVPSLALRLILGEMGTMLTEGQRVSSEKIASHGYNFKFPTVDLALKDLFK